MAKEINIAWSALDGKMLRQIPQTSGIVFEDQCQDEIMQKLDTWNSGEFPSKDNFKLAKTSGKFRSSANGDY